MKALIVFTDSELLLAKFLKCKFRHCILYINRDEDPVNFICIDQLRGQLRVYNALIDEDAIKLFHAADVIVEYNFEKIKPRKIWSFGLFSCVNTIKNILGINKFWVMTPYQLYKYITR